MNKTVDFDRVADLYDSYVATDLDIPFFLSEAQAAGGDILELMCGTGRVTIPLLERGLNITCVDYSAKMLDKFREKIKDTDLKAELIEADVKKLNLGRKFSLIYIPFHAFQEILAEDEQRETLGRICDHLADDGKFICTLQNPKIRLQNCDGQIRVLGKFPHGDKDMIINIVFYQNPDTKIVHGFQFYEFYDKSGIMDEKRILEIKFRLSEAHEFEELAKSAGFKVERLYGDYIKGKFDSEKSPFMIFILSKK